MCGVCTQNYHGSVILISFPINSCSRGFGKQILTFLYISQCTAVSLRAVGVDLTMRCAQWFGTCIKNQCIAPLFHIGLCKSDKQTGFNLRGFQHLFVPAV